MKIIKVAGLVLLIAFGIFMVVYGEHDDSPGAQLLGVVLGLAGMWFTFKTLRTK